MVRKLLVGAVAASLLAASGSMLYAQDKAAAAVGSYKIDPVHSFVTFRVTHFNVGATYGVVVGPAGTFEQTTDSINLTISMDVDKLTTFNDARDKHLKGPDFFSAKQFPQMTFKSTAAKKTEDGYQVTGDMTIKGTTKSIVVDLKKIGEGKGMNNESRVGYETKFTVNRMDYGVDHYPDTVGKEVIVDVAFEAIKE